MDIFFVKLKETLNRVLIWSDFFFNGNRNYNFDIDDELYNLSKEYSVDFKQGDLLLIYNLLDFFCDAVKHSFKQIDKNYSMSEAREDIKKIIVSLPEAGKPSILELSEDLKKRLKDL